MTRTKIGTSKLGMGPICYRTDRTWMKKVQISNKIESKYIKKYATIESKKY
jgi:hypothetical protein